MKKTLLIMITGAALACGCAQSAPPTASPTAAASPVVSGSPSVEATSAPAAEVSEEVKKKAEEILAGRKNDRFDYKQMSVKENGPVFIYLATTSDDPKVVTQALEGMKKTHRSDKESEKMNLAGEAYDAAIIKCLGSSDKTILHYALKSSSKALGDTPNAKVVEMIVDIAQNHKEVGARHEAVDALSSVKDFEKDSALADVFIKAMKDDAPVASLALFRRQFGFSRGDKSEVYKTTVVELLEHADPGVRGRALIALAELYSDDKELILSKSEAMLKDENPFVRSSALSALSRIKGPKAIDLIITLVDDAEKNTYDIKYQNLLGQSDSVHHDGSAWSTVNDAALSALKSATYSLPEAERFVYDKINYKTVEADIAKQAKKAKAWHAEYKKKNPS